MLANPARINSSISQMAVKVVPPLDLILLVDLVVVTCGDDAVGLVVLVVRVAWVTEPWCFTTRAPLP